MSFLICALRAKRPLKGLGIEFVSPSWLLRQTLVDFLNRLDLTCRWISAQPWKIILNNCRSPICLQEQGCIQERKVNPPSLEERDIFWQYKPYFLNVETIVKTNPQNFFFLNKKNQSGCISKVQKLNQNVCASLKRNIRLGNKAEFCYPCSSHIYTKFSRNLS